MFTIALSVLITLEPSKRAYDPDSRDRLVELFGEPERWAATTSSIRWAQVDSLVPGFEGATEFDLPIACSYDLELAASKYLYGLADGDAPLRFHFNGTVFYEAEAGRMQVVQVRGIATRYGCPSRRGGGRSRPTTRTGRVPSTPRRWPGCSGSSWSGPAELRRRGRRAARSRGRGMNAAVDHLVSSLLYEGYALYPYTPGATKNATPTPFGIVYPPAYADLLETAFDHLRVECVLLDCEGAELEGEVRFLQVAGERHQAVERRLSCRRPRSPSCSATAPAASSSSPASGPCAAACGCAAEVAEPRATLIRACVHNTTELDAARPSASIAPARCGRACSRRT